MITEEIARTTLMNQQLNWSKKIVIDNGRFQTLKKEKESSRGDLKETQRERIIEAAEETKSKKNMDKWV